MIKSRFDVGETVVRRDVFREKVWTASPHRVLADDGDRITLAYWPGIVSLAPCAWIASLETGNPAERDRMTVDLASGQWRLGRWTWRDTLWVSGQRVGDYCPYRRTEWGIDTFDLLLDLIVESDLSGYRWKDEDEYRQGRRLGVISDMEHRAVQEARDQVIALIEQRRGPFAESWTINLTWPLPMLPLDLPGA
ncbi:YgaC family protein [Microtetraspora sp. AC03309]|uniref:YgaC family protein n=1 Tax=Microtetraspora sp. AC03309 TaxID=2779376 RepID=UPI001E3E98AC|nr:YgaC family protein [Microtetraspora sp. AC03309]MCC5574660.1 YgaC family protein [Microtetraspora sp. AC03309]